MMPSSLKIESDGLDPVIGKRATCDFQTVIVNSVMTFLKLMREDLLFKIGVRHNNLQVRDLLELVSNYMAPVVVNSGVEA